MSAFRVASGHAYGRPKAPPKAKKPQREGDDPAYRAALRLMPCAIDKECGVVDGHHQNHLGTRGKGQRVPDRYCIPLSRARHDELHRVGSRYHERWLLAFGVDGGALSNELWRIWCHEPADRRLDLMRHAVMEHTA